MRKEIVIVFSTIYDLLFTSPSGNLYHLKPTRKDNTFQIIMFAKMKHGTGHILCMRKNKMHFPLQVLADSFTGPSQYKNLSTSIKILHRITGNIRANHNHLTTKKGKPCP